MKLHWHWFPMTCAMLFLTSMAFKVNANFDFNSYTASSISQIINERKADFSGPGDAQDMLVSGAIFKYKINVPFSKQLRRISPEKLSFIRYYGTSHRIPQAFVDQFQAEFLIQQNGRDFWVPIQQQLLVSMGKELQEGKSFDLYVVYAGALKREPIFLANEFRAQSTAEPPVGAANAAVPPVDSVSDALTQQLKGKRLTYLRAENRFQELPKLKDVRDVTWKIAVSEASSAFDNKGALVFAFVLEQPGYDRPISEKLGFVLATGVGERLKSGDFPQYEIRSALAVDTGLSRMKNGTAVSNTTNISRAMNIGGDGGWPVCIMSNDGKGGAPIVVLRATDEAKRPYILSKAWRVDLATESFAPIDIGKVQCRMQQPL